MEEKKDNATKSRDEALETCDLDKEVEELSEDELDGASGGKADNTQSNRGQQRVLR